MCGTICLVRAWDDLPGKIRTKRKAREWSRIFGFRSMSEVKYRNFLDAHGIENEYEPDTFKYQLPTAKYTPDFKINGIRSKLRTDMGKQEPRTNAPIYLEYKGVLTGKDRKKLRYVRRSNPDLDIRLVFERPQNKINRLSRTTYAEWATKNKFQWYDAHDLDELLRELESKK